MKKTTKQSIKAAMAEEAALRRVRRAREVVAFARKEYLNATRQVMKAWESNEVWGTVWAAEAREESLKRRYFAAAESLRGAMYSVEV